MEDFNDFDQEIERMNDDEKEKFILKAMDEKNKKIFIKSCVIG